MGKALIGIDLGHASVKVAAVSTGNKHRLIGCAMIPVDPGLLNKEGLKEPALVADAITQALQIATPKHLAKGPAVIALSESLLFRRIIDLPTSTPLNKETIKLQAAEFLPLPVDEMELDFLLLPQPEAAIVRQVIVVAAASKAIAEYVQVMKLAGLQLQAIDAKPSCVGRALDLPIAQPSLLIDIGSEQVTLSILKSGLVCVAAIINTGANSLADAATGQPLTGDQAEAANARLASAIADEAGHVIKFFASRESVSPGVVSAAVAGGGAEQGPLLAALARELSVKIIEVAAVVPLPPSCDRRYLGAIGASLYPFK